MFKSPLLLAALTITGAVALWGLLDNDSLAAFGAAAVGMMFSTRGWFIMLTASVLLVAVIGLVVSPYGRLKLGADDDQPEFSTISWLTMLFAAGMGVGLLYFGAAEPATHFLVIRDYQSTEEAAGSALFITYFHWGLHAWAIYAMTGLVIAYFSFRKGLPILLSAPFEYVFSATGWPRVIGWVANLMAIVAIAIGLGGSIAIGVFQVQGGLVSMFGIDDPGVWLPAAIFAALCVAFTLPLLVDLGAGMAKMSNAAMAIAGALVVFVLLVGPTSFFMNVITSSIGGYFWNVLPHGFETYSFFGEQIDRWFQDWTLNYMVWWLAWSPFVGVFIARISRGRTIREYLIGVVVVPTAFSIFWFGTFGGMGFVEGAKENSELLDVVTNNIDQTTFYLLQTLPLGMLTSAATVIAAFLFIVTSVVSAAFVLGMFSTGGDPNPGTQVKLVWGVILAALGLVMILSGDLATVRSLIALGALPFVYVVLLLMVCLLKALKDERPSDPHPEAH